MTSSIATEPAVVSLRASVSDRAAIEELISSFPPCVAEHARGMIKIPGSRRIRFVEVLRSVYVLCYRRIDNVSTCTTLRNIKSEDDAIELWNEIEKLSTPDTAIMRRLHAKVTGLTAD